MKFYDITWPIFNGMTAYKDRAVVAIKATKTYEQDGVRESLITIGSHTGTHIDAPAHFLKEGKSLEEINPLACVGFAQVIDMTHVESCIAAAEIKELRIEPRTIVLFKTKNSARSVQDPFDHNFVYIDASAAQALTELHVQAVGIDYLGIERAQPGHETHTLLLQHNILILEGIRLGHVAAGNYFLWCLPLCIPGIDGVPARAVLIEA